MPSSQVRPLRLLRRDPRDERRGYKDGITSSSTTFSSSPKAVRSRPQDRQIRGRRRPVLRRQGRAHPQGQHLRTKDNSPSNSRQARRHRAPISGFTPKLDYSTGNNTATVEVSGKVDKATVTLKADADIEGKKSKGASAKVFPLPEGVKATVEVKDDKSPRLS